MQTNTMVSNIYNNYGNSYKSSDRLKESTKKNAADSVESIQQTSAYGNSIGNVKLSEEGAKYYEELKKKFKDQDFVLVSNDQVENAQRSASQYENTGKIVVLIDVDKIERMAADEGLRKQVESQIGNGIEQLTKAQESIESLGLGDQIKNIGIQINEDGSTSFFASLKQASKEQKARMDKQIQKHREEAKKAEAKKEEQKTKEKREKETILKADSFDEFMQKLYSISDRSNLVQTEEEKVLGQTIDFRG